MNESHVQYNNHHLLIYICCVRTGSNTGASRDLGTSGDCLHQLVQQSSASTPPSLQQGIRAIILNNPSVSQEPESCLSP